MAALNELCNPDLYPFEAAVNKAKELMTLNPRLDLELAAMAPRKTTEAADRLAGPSVERLLDLLDTISPGVRTLNSLVHLLDDPDLRIRSKAAILIGRRVGNLHWAERVLEDQNPRVRANVIEALWESALPQCREVFYRALNDSDNRVVGNAIYGIYRLNPVESVPLLIGLAAHPEPARRVTAAWVMGRTCDLQFRPHVQKMVQDKEKQVRSLALKAMFKLKAAQNAA